MTEFEAHDAHHHGDCGIDCPLCAVAELDRIAALRRPGGIPTEADAYFIAPDQLERECLWRIGDDVDAPALVVRADEFRDAGAWDLVVLGLRIAQAAVAE